MNHDIGRLRRCEALFFRTRLEKYGLLPLEGRLLILLDGPLCAQEDLSVRLDMDKGRITRAISTLEERGFICRETNAMDKRQKMASLTAAGKEMVTKIREVFQAWDQVCYQGFTEEEKQLHQSFLKRIAENAMEYRHRNGVDRND